MFFSDFLVDYNGIFCSANFASWTVFKFKSVLTLYSTFLLKCKEYVFTNCGSYFNLEKITLQLTRHCFTPHYGDVRIKLNAGVGGKTNVCIRVLVMVMFSFATSSISPFPGSDAYAFCIIQSFHNVVQFVKHISTFCRHYQNLLSGWPD